MSLKLHLFVNQQYNMDVIDITDSAFSLDVPNILSAGASGSTDYTMFIYIGAAILVAIIGMFIYKFYQNKKNQEEDCQGGFCTMEHNPNRQI